MLNNKVKPIEVEETSDNERSSNLDQNLENPDNTSAGTYLHIYTKL